MDEASGSSEPDISAIVALVNDKFNEAVNTLDMDWHLSTFEGMLVERFGMFSEFAKKHSIQLSKFAEKRNIIVGLWINELIRFLVLKHIVKLDSMEPIERELVTDGVVISYDENENFAVCPSGYIRISWMCFLLLPRSYQTICNVISGNANDGPIDIDRKKIRLKDTIDKKSFHDEIEVKQSEVGAYEQTLALYECVFKQKPPKMFWPPIETIKNEKSSASMTSCGTV